MIPAVRPVISDGRTSEAARLEDGAASGASGAVVAALGVEPGLVLGVVAKTGVDVVGGELWLVGLILEDVALGHARSVAAAAEPETTAP